MSNRLLRKTYYTHCQSVGYTVTTVPHRTLQNLSSTKNLLTHWLLLGQHRGAATNGS